MKARFAVIAAAALAGSAAFAAEPPKAPVKDAAQPKVAAPVILASADKLPTPAPDQAAPAPVKKRAARVTTCRCGDQVAEQPEQ